MRIIKSDYGILCEVKLTHPKHPTEYYHYTIAENYSERNAERKAILKFVELHSDSHMQDMEIIFSYIENGELYAKEYILENFREQHLKLC